MKCEAIHKLLTQFLLGDLPSGVADEVRSHLQDCESCRAEAAEIELTLDLLRDALATASDAPTGLESSHYAKIYSASVLEPQRKSGRPTVISYIGTWFVNYHHQLAAAVAMICLGSLLLSVSIVQFGGSSKKARKKADELLNSAMEVRIKEPEPVEELEDIEELVMEDRPMSSDVAEAEADGDGLTVFKYEVPAPSFVGTPKSVKSDKSDKLESHELADLRKRSLKGKGDDMGSVPSLSPLTDFSPQPAEFDSVAMVKSPVIMKGIYGSRSPGARGADLQAYGGNAADDAFASDDDIEITIDLSEDKYQVGFDTKGEAGNTRPIGSSGLALAGGKGFSGEVSSTHEQEVPMDLQLFADMTVANDSVKDDVSGFEKAQNVPQSELSRRDKRLVKGDSGAELPATASHAVKAQDIENAKGQKDELALWLDGKPGKQAIIREALDSEEMPPEGMVLGGAIVTETEDLISDLLEASADADREEEQAGRVSSFGAKGKSAKKKPERKEQDGRSNVGRAGMSMGEMAAASGTIQSETELRRGSAIRPSGQIDVDGEGDTKATGGGKKNFDENERWNSTPNDENNLLKSAEEMVDTAYTMEATVLPSPELDRKLPPPPARSVSSAETVQKKLNDEALAGPKFKAFGVNPFIATKDNAFSTFAIDVDTASYTLARNYMQRGFLPPAESVRTEEFVNFFDYDYAPPVKDTFKIYTECAPSKFGSGMNMLKIGVKGRAIGREEQEKAVLTFVVDCSGSMNTLDRIGLLKKSLELLLEKLDSDDEIAIVQFGSKARLVLEHTPISEKKKILDAVNSLQTSGSTNLEEAMLLAYQIAAKEFKPGASNRVLIMSDGAANIGEGAADEILRKVERCKKQGIFCSVFGFGIGTYNDEMLETLANKGNGTYLFIDNEDEARRVFVDELSATLNMIAADVKIQVEFDPQSVTKYRQLGYENRQLKKHEFRDNSVDAGEVGSGQSVTALYEVKLADQPVAFAGKSPDLAIVRVRYRRTDTGAIEEIEKRVTMSELIPDYNQVSSKFKLAGAVAEFAEILRGSPYAAGSEYNSVAEVLRPIALEYNLDRRIRELTSMVENAGGMSRGE